MLGYFVSIFGLPVISRVPYFLSGFLAQVLGIEFVEYIYMYLISRFLPATHSRRLHLITYIYTYTDFRTLMYSRSVICKYDSHLHQEQ